MRMGVQYERDGVTLIERHRTSDVNLNRTEQIVVVRTKPRGVDQIGLLFQGLLITQRQISGSSHSSINGGLQKRFRRGLMT